MKRLFFVIMILLFALPAVCVPAAADSEPLSLSYVPRTERGTLFYLDVSAAADLSAAMFRLEYDPSSVEYRGVFSEDDDASVMGNAENGILRVVYSRRSSSSGKLFRIAFMALRQGETAFSLSAEQAVDGDLQFLTGISGYTLKVKLGKDDVVYSESDESSREDGISAEADDSSGASGSSKSSSSAKSANSSKTSGAGKQSDSKAETDAAKDHPSATELCEEALGEKETAEDSGIFRDFSEKDSTSFLLLGGGVVLLAGLLVTAGVIIGKTYRKKRVPEEDDADALPEERGEEAEPEDADLEEELLPPQLPENSPEEIFRDIE